MMHHAVWQLKTLPAWTPIPLEHVSKQARIRLCSTAQQLLEPLPTLSCIEQAAGVQPCCCRVLSKHTTSAFNLQPPACGVGAINNSRMLQIAECSPNTQNPEQIPAMMLAAAPLHMIITSWPRHPRQALAEDITGQSKPSCHT